MENRSAADQMNSVTAFLCLRLSSFLYHPVIIFCQLYCEWFTQLPGQICVTLPSSLCRPACKCLSLAAARVQLDHDTSWCSCWKQSTFGWGWMETLAHLLNTNYQSGSALCLCFGLWALSGRETCLASCVNAFWPLTGSDYWFLMVALCHHFGFRLPSRLLNRFREHRCETVKMIFVCVVSSCQNSVIFK